MIRMQEPSGSRSISAQPMVPRAWHFPLVLGLLGLVVGGCGGGATDESNPGVAAAIKILTQPPATAVARQVLSTAPVVQVVDDAGDPVAQAGISIIVTIQTGGGSLAGTTAVQTNASGQATFANVSIGGLVGSKVLRFAGSGITGVNSSGIMLTAGPAAVLAASSTTNQTTLLGTAVTAKPSVKATDLDGNPVAGVAVTFAITGGGGSMTGGDQVTSALGIATVGSWTVGANPGANTMTASATGLTGSPVTFTATGSATVSNFTIDVVYLTSATANQQAAFAAAKARWEAIVTGDQVDMTISSPIDITACGATNGTTVSGTIDDVKIYVVLEAIDGPGNILGAAGPCILRQSGTRLPSVGVMKFDIADLADIEAQGELADVILHEMAHVLGYGTLWQAIPGFWTLNLITGVCTSNSVFTGAGAVNAYTNLNGGTGTSVPIENTGACDDGTRDSHWRETTFQDELMTGFITGATRPLSATTIRSVEDLGYVVNVAAADAFTTPNPFVALRKTPAVQGRHLKGDVLKGPLFSYDEATGQLHQLRR